MRRALRVVVIDDHRDYAAVLAFAFEALGHRARVAHDAPHGLGLVLATAPHLVLVEVVMPRTHGWSIARAIRSMPLTHQPRLIALSSCSQLVDQLCALAAGFDEHCTKPIAIDTLARLTCCAAC